MSKGIVCASCSVIVLLMLAVPALAAKPPNVRAALGLKPTQKGVKYDRPTVGEVDRCTVKAEKGSGGTGWIVESPDGSVLRRFVDTNNDNVVDQWCYFAAGIEVYRDIDSNNNGKVDEHRWLNTAGSRWSIDGDEDGKLDYWRVLSAEEASAEVVAALAEASPTRFRKVLLSVKELKSLGLGASLSKKLREKIATAEARFRKLVARPMIVTSVTKWIDFSASQPGVVPAGSEGSTKDVMVYESVAAMVETGGKPGLVHVGTLIRVGKTWKVIDVPQVSNDSQTAEFRGSGFFFQVAHVGQGATAGGSPRNVEGELSQKMQDLITQLQKLDRQLNTAKTPAQQASINRQRAALLEKLEKASRTSTERKTWVQQLADMLSAAVQAGDFPEGVGRLEVLAARLAKGKASRDLGAYVSYRALMADYSVRMQAPKADFAKVQKKWLADLEAFVKKFPKATDTSEAMLQLALAQEFAGEEDEAKSWYKRIMSDFASSSVAKKAAGALRRLNSVGRTITLQGKDFYDRSIDLTRYKGHLVVIQYWATWCEPCKADMEALKSLVGKYGKQGFSVLGVNLDTERTAAAAFLKQERLPWINLYAPGGLESRFATEMGVLSLPTMILVDKMGKVVNRGIHVSELETELKKRLK